MRVIAIIASVLLLASCSGSKDHTAGVSSGNTSPAPTSATPTVSTTTPTTAPKPATPATLTRAQAGVRYLAIVAPFNKLADDEKCEAVGDFTMNGGTWPPDGHNNWDDHAERVAQSCFKLYAAAMGKQITELQKAAWPVEAAADIADLVSLNQGQLHCYRQGAKGASDSYDTYACVPKDDGSPDRVRARFGLPTRTTT